MVTVLNFKDVIDLPKWRPLSPPIGVTAITNTALACDYRNNDDRHPLIYLSAITTNFNSYNAMTDEWERLSSQALASTTTVAFFMPAQGPRGTIAAGATTTSIPLSTALPATVGINQLSNRGDGRGFKVRIIGNAGGSSGLIEERIVVANTGATTTPTLTLNSPLSFVPTNGDTYEFLSGRVFILGSSTAAGSWKYYDILTNSFSGNLSVVNLAVSTLDNNLVGLDELLVPYDRAPGEGFLGILTATASGAASLTGQAIGGDTTVLADEYRNFQIRIVQDIAIPTAVGQRRNITTHTAGPSPVYTVPAWVVTPSANAIYVIENNGDRIIEWRQGSTQTLTYTISTDTWDVNVTFAARPAVPGLGLMSHQAFSIEPDINKNARHSYIFCTRSSGTSTIDIFDIAGAATGLWTADITYGNKSANLLFDGGGSSTQDPATMQGRYIYINGANGLLSQRFYRFDMKNSVMEPYTFLRMPLAVITISSTPVKLLAYTVFIDGDTKLSFIILNTRNLDNNAQIVFSLPITR